jgi:hypothetical protein
MMVAVNVPNPIKSAVAATMNLYEATPKAANPIARPTHQLVPSFSVNQSVMSFFTSPPD